MPEPGLGNIGAYNLGNALGAALGEGVIAARLSDPAVALAGATTSAVELLAVLLAALRALRTRKKPEGALPQH